MDHAAVAAPIDRRATAATLRPRDDAGGSDSSLHQGDASLRSRRIDDGRLGTCGPRSGSSTLVDGIGLGF